MTQSYARTWCDYLTGCQFNPGVMIGGYECEQCQHFISRKEAPAKKFDSCDYSKYSYIFKGIVECNI